MRHKVRLLPWNGSPLQQKRAFGRNNVLRGATVDLPDVQRRPWRREGIVSLVLKFAGKEFDLTKEASGGKDCRAARLGEGAVGSFAFDVNRGETIPFPGARGSERSWLTDNSVSCVKRFLFNEKTGASATNFFVRGEDQAKWAHQRRRIHFRYGAEHTGQKAFHIAGAAAMKHAVVF